MDQLALGRLGRTLNGKWRLDAVLGVGGMATVYAATHRNGHRVAVKMLHPVLSAQDAPRERFMREGYIANKVDHRDAVRVLDEDVDDAGNVFLVMELLEGESVASRWRATGSRLPAGEVLWIAHRLLGVLESAHANGVVHRDIKPENLFLTKGGDLKVLDFGIARFGVTRTGNTIQGIVMGTPGFAAPEQVRGEWDVVDARADLFAVGATIFALIVGKLVHERPTPDAYLKRIALDPAPAAREVDATVPEPVARLIDRALSFRPEDRFQTAAEMREAVASAFSFITGQPLSERISAPQRTPTPKALSEAAPTVVSAGLTRRPSEGRPSGRSRLVPILGIGIGLLGAVYWGSGAQWRAPGANSRASVPPPSARAAEPAPSLDRSQREMELVIPTMATPQTPAIPEPASSAAERIAPPPSIVPPAPSVTPPPPTTVSPPPTIALPPPTIDNSARAPASVPRAGRLDFVDTRH